MKKNIPLLVLSIIFLGLQVIAETLTAVLVVRLNLLPDQYIVILVLALALLAMFTALLMFLRFKKPVGTARRIIACVLALLIVCGCGLIAKLAVDAYQTIHAVTGEEVTNVRNMYVFVRKDDPAQTLADTKDYSFAIIENYDVEHTQQAILAIGEATNTEVVVAQYEKATDLADALFDERVDALIINGAAVTLMMEEEGYADFAQKARILHEMPQEDLEATTETTTEETVEEVKEITERPFIVYISGSDTRNEKLKTSRSDVNILVVVNPVTKQILLLNTPRDYYVPNPIGNGALDKLTHCGLYGVRNSMNALGDLYDVEVDYHAQINFTGFETLIDAVGGVTIYSDKSFTARETHIKKGENALNGSQALDLVRERYHVSGGDNGRGKNQMKVIKALIEKLTSGKTIISKYSKILDSLKGMFKTDVSSEDISLLVKMQLSDMAQWNVQSFAVTGTGGSETNYSSPGHKAYVMYPHENMVAYASTLVNKVLNGETLTDADMKVPKS